MAECNYNVCLYCCNTFIFLVLVKHKLSWWFPVIYCMVFPSISAVSLSLMQKTSRTCHVSVECTQLVSWQKVIRASALITCYSVKLWFSPTTAGNTPTRLWIDTINSVAKSSEREKGGKRGRVITGGRDVFKFVKVNNRVTVGQINGRGKMKGRQTHMNT